MTAHSQVRKKKHKKHVDFYRCLISHKTHTHTTNTNKQPINMEFAIIVIEWLIQSQRAVVDERKKCCKEKRKTETTLPQYKLKNYVTKTTAIR